MKRELATAALTLLLVGCSTPDTLESLDNPSATSPADELSPYERFVHEIQQRVPLDEYPNVEPIRFVRSDERGDELVSCLTDAGFDAKKEKVGYGVDSGPGQGDSMMRAIYVCEASYPLHHVYLTPFNDEQLEIIYEWTVEEYIPCLTTNGAMVREMPSLETFIAEYKANDSSLWSPVLPEEEGGINPPSDAQACVPWDDDPLVASYEAGQGS